MISCLGGGITDPWRLRVYGLALALLILTLFVLTLAVVEVRQYRAGRVLISRRRFLLRMLAGMLMLLLLAAVFVGLFVLRLGDAQARPQLFLGYWFGCISVAAALVWVMLSDMHEVEELSSRRQHQLWREMARFVAEHMKRDDADRVTAEGDKKE
jgi:Tfp pilus assembly protein PilN